MGKKQHQKDKLYLTTTEWSSQYGGYKKRADQDPEFRRLPFDYCSISMTKFEDPLCTKDGHIFDIKNIVPFLRKFGINPCTGEKMTAKDLIHLNFYKNSDGQYHCPVTFSVFTKHSKIVAVKPTGNVYSRDAVDKLNVKVGNYRDLMNDEPFQKSDIITLQDPNDLEKCNLVNFFHVKNNLKLTSKDADSKSKIKSSTSMTQSVLDELEKTYKAPVKQEQESVVADSLNAAHYSTGRVAASFTSTAMAPVTEHETAIIDEDILRYERVKSLKKKGYVTLKTNYGALNIELFCDMVPKTCENFLKHCKNGYYTGTKFHRLIRNFMLQGGDPTGTGTGGESIWGGTFKDEFKPNLMHVGRGVLSMANSGPNTNKSQFFITFRSAQHLDTKHSVFGKIVGGLHVLDEIEKIETNKKDKPLKDITIEDTKIYFDPYEQADEMLKKDRELDSIVAKAREDDLIYEKQKKKTQPKETLEVVTESRSPLFKTGVGKYISMAQNRYKRPSNEELSETEKKKAKFVPGKLGDFSSW